MIANGQLSAGLAHEIGSPLQVMAGRAAMLADSGDPEVRRQANLLVEQCARITKIVEALLSFGRRAPAAFAPCDLAVPVRRVIELLEGEARRRQLALGFSGWTDAAVLVSADADQIQQVVLNLVTNAMNSTPAGGTITVSLVTVGSGVELRVKDSGRGIPEDMQARLFEPFFTTRATEGGSGPRVRGRQKCDRRSFTSWNDRGDAARSDTERSWWFVFHAQGGEGHELSERVADPGGRRRQGGRRVSCSRRWGAD